MTEVTLTAEEAAALARYIARQGIPYGPDDGPILSIRQKVTGETSARPR